MTLARLAAVLVLALAACGGAAKPATVRNGAGPAVTAGTVRAVDWANRTYQFGDEGPWTVVDGEYNFAYDSDGNPVPGDYQAKDDEYVERGSFSVGTPLFGDLTGDGAEEAVLVTYFDGGGTGRFTSVNVFGMKDGKAVEIGGIPGGDRADGGIDGVVLDGAKVMVDRYATQSGACCPDTLVHETWKWNGVAFVEDEAARTSEPYDGPS